MCETINFEDIKPELKKQKFKAKIREAANKAKETAKKAVKWCKDNPEIAGLIAVGLGKVGHDIYRDVRSDMRERREINSRERRTYDPQTGDWYDLKRSLSNREKEEIRHRLDDGERKVDILRDMRVLR